MEGQKSALGACYHLGRSTAHERSVPEVPTHRSGVGICLLTMQQMSENMTQPIQLNAGWITILDIVLCWTSSCAGHRPVLDIVLC